MSGTFIPVTFAGRRKMLLTLLHLLLAWLIANELVLLWLLLARRQTPSPDCED
jgi:hypothetical protein